MSDRKVRWGTVAKVAVAVGIAVFISRSFAHYFGEVRHSLAEVDYRFLLASLAVCVAYRVLNSAGWVVILRAMHQSMPLGRGMRMWILAESMRWLPGGVWSLVTRVVQATKFGIPAAIASASLTLELGLTLLAWGIVAAAGVLGSGHALSLAGFVSPKVVALVGGALLAVAAVVILCAVRLPEGKIASKLKSLRDGLLTLRTLRLRPWLLVGVLVYFTVLCVVNGAAFYLVLRSVSSGPLDLSAIVGINACGWLIGFFAVGAPGGLGVREAGSAFLLSSMMPPAQAIAASVLWRLVMMVDELLSLSGCLVPNLLRWLGRRAIPCESAN